MRGATLHFLCAASRARIRFTSEDQKRVFVAGEVLEVTPPNRFVHTYIMTMDEDPETVVAWDLAEEGNGCRVTLTHSGWTDQHVSEDKTVKAWGEILELLRGVVESNSLPLKTRVSYTLMGLFSFALPKRTTKEHADAQGW